MKPVAVILAILLAFLLGATTDHPLVNHQVLVVVDAVYVK